MTGPLPIAPVHVEIAPKQFRAVNSIAEAAEMLMTSWPQAGRGSAHRMAVRSCLAALEGSAMATSARNAFIRAAVEAGLYVRAEEHR